MMKNYHQNSKKRLFVECHNTNKIRGFGTFLGYCDGEFI